MATFLPFPEKFTYAELEQEILAFWDAQEIFEKSIAQRADATTFTFYEGPPSVNGKPGIHHVMARTLKDLVCRYKTITGHKVMRKAGWDTHGLPIEVALEKELKFEQKSDIETYGVAKFNRRAKDFVYHHIEYPEGWQKLTERMGYWINLEDAYITCTNDYIESVWWALAEFFRKGLIYKGFKIVPQCPHCETPLSSHELALGYADVQDMNVYVKFPCVDEDANILVWTTTPWTLISNVALAVHPDVEYVRIRTAEHGVLYLAKERLGVIGEEYEILAEMHGRDLLGKEYHRLFDYVPVEKKAFYIVAGDFVTTADGSGIVHIAPAFGVDDYEMMKQNDLPFILPVTTAGRFTDEVTDFAGRLVKTLQFTTHREDGVDPDIIRLLKEKGRIYRASKDYLHSYPHCWRCDNPLIYYARDSWYIRTTEYAARMIELNHEINWCPPEVGAGRFGNWLEDNKDWSLSRDRYWGTPLPIWIAEDGSDMFIVGSIDELLKGFRLVDGARVAPRRDEIDLHKPWVDEILFERDGKIYRRTPELIDVWFDSGAMPFAQYHYPFENREVFEKNFPSDFICEGIDQTRGWFYTLHAIATALFDRPAFKNLIVNELVLDKNGQKMSKSRGNVVDPFIVLEQYGADATRWYLAVSSPPWRQTMFNEKDIEGVQRNFFRALLNTYQFFALYANIDGFTGGEDSVPLADRPEIDQWILTELNALLRDVRASMDAYDVTPAARAISEFTIDQLSNWYVRRNRRRFWKGQMSADKLAAYQTLHECLRTIAQLMSPFAPFLSEHLYRRLTAGMPGASESVHLAMLPEPGTIDEGLKQRMHDAQRVVFLTRGLREQTRIKTRQPLARILVATTAPHLVAHVEAMRDVILEETNIKTVEFIANDNEMLRKKAKPNFKVIGPKYGKYVKGITTRVQAFTSDEINRLEADGTIGVTIDGEELLLSRDDIEIQHQDIEGWTIGADVDLVVALDTTLSEDLIAEGTAREFVSKIQALRKESGFAVTDRILIVCESSDETFMRAILRMESYICAETLAEKIVSDAIPAGGGTQLEVNDSRCVVSITTTRAE
ncbi:MAG: isoleucine--tRNA ligase [Bacteroidota bacterium]|jgi:isoleucyl-tRNA synthetase|nr:isoleucine--tRNA ligase [Bacteroidota bacterium]